MENALFLIRHFQVQTNYELWCSWVVLTELDCCQSSQLTCSHFEPSPWHTPAEDDDTSIFDEHKIEEADRRQQGESLSSISLSIERLLLNIDNCLTLMDSTSNGWLKLPFNFSQLVWHSDILNQATHGCWMPPLPRMIFKTIRIICPTYFPGNRPVNQVVWRELQLLVDWHIG